MASRAIIDGRASALPLSVALSVIPSLPRPLLARLVERAIERLDAMDGDADIEANGDELDGTSAEDEIGTNLAFCGGGGGGAGCPISDPDEPDDHGENEHDAEIETWSHPDDHPAQLFIGRRSA